KATMRKLGALLAIIFVLPNAITHPLRGNSGEATLRALNSAARNGKINCIACSTIVQGINQLLADHEDEEIINEFLKKACVTLDVDQPYICDAMVDQFASEVYFVLARVDFTPDEICGIFVSDCGTPVNPLKVLWNLTIPGGKPPVKPWPTVTAPKRTQRVLHLSDLHIDRQYTEGSEADCQDDSHQMALCCRNYPNTEQNSTIREPAGKWGALNNCDLPYRTFEAAMRHIAATHKDLDYIIITGDLQSHDEWDYTRENTAASIANITRALLEFFPSTPIYQAIGNHESAPCDAMAPHGMEEYYKRGPAWVYALLASAWSKWISPEAVKFVQYRASYVAYPAPWLKLISINSIYCSHHNFYMYINQTDPDGTLAWLIIELLDAETKGLKVHVISHIPPGDDSCLMGWSHNFYEIVNRFENTIAAQFYGHTHGDHFQMIFENSDPLGRPTHFNFIAPSLTTHTYKNPAYRIYTIDGGYAGASYTVIDAETYTTDIPEANKQGREPTFYLEYSTREAYGMSDLSPSSWADLIDRLEVDDALFEKFHRFYWRSAYGHDCVTDIYCRQRYICYLRSAKSYEEGLFCPGLH
ncbi:hypothetical protein PMAYCL1PPCAC_10820, partial [Pristionchus mayeri]